jgi:glycosyltransferase involved in cell wall biosynthesis
LVIVGPAFPNERGMAYGKLVEQAVANHSHVTWIPGIDHDDPLLASAYAAAAVHVLPSTAEAQGIVSLEAAAAGARVVVSDLPSLRSLFGSDVLYANPQSTAAIRNAIKTALAMPQATYRTSRPDWLLTWTDVAQRTIEVYRRVLTGTA